MWLVTFRTEYDKPIVAKKKVYTKRESCTAAIKDWESQPLHSTSVEYVEEG